jgi:hypothetical protein
MQLSDGDIQIKSLPAEVGISSSAEIFKYLVYFRDWAILIVCTSDKSRAEIEQALRENNLPEVVHIQHESANGNDVEQNQNPET